MIESLTMQDRQREQTNNSGKSPRNGPGSEQAAGNAAAGRRRRSKASALHEIEAADQLRPSRSPILSGRNVSVISVISSSSTGIMLCVDAACCWLLLPPSLTRLWTSPRTAAAADLVFS
jgi:hypothetical protein